MTTSSSGTLRAQIPRTQTPRPRRAHAVPYHCPYCADEALFPHGEERGAWECRSCLRAFKVAFLGQLAPPSPSGTTPDERRHTR